MSWDRDSDAENMKLLPTPHIIIKLLTTVAELKLLTNFWR